MQHINKPVLGQKPQVDINSTVQPGLKSKAQSYLSQTQQSGIEKPKDEAPKSGGPSMLERRVSILVNSFGRKVDDLCLGLQKMGLLKEDGAIEALEKVVGKEIAGKVWFKARQQTLSTHMHNTGRDDFQTEGGNEKREALTGKILSGIESSTQENQTMRDKVTKAPKPSPKAHPVSAHGKGSNQVARLVSGHRGDEVDSLKGGDQVTLDGNKNDLGPTSVPKVDTVGSAPSNQTGAFTTNQGMLHVINEAFAQGSMVESFAQQERRDGKLNTMDQERIAPNVEGPGGKLGEGMELQGHYKQKAGTGLSKDEMEQRFKDVKNTGEQKNARMVLDPAFNEKGARVGWNLQTAYANNDKPTENFKNVGDVSKSPKAARQRAKQLKTSVESQTKSVGELEVKLLAVPTNLGFKQKALPGRKKKLEEAEKKVSTASEGKQKEEAIKAEAIARGLYETIVKEIDQLENVEKPQIEKQLQEAKDKLVELEKELKEAEEVVSKLPPEKIEGSDEETTETTNDKSPMQGVSGGYDGKTGQWVGGRPGKPSGSDELKGLDESGKNLTAHHLYPWNKIESDLNSALSSKSVSAMEKLLSFAGESVSDNFWKEFKLEPKDRSYQFAEELNRIVPHICWSPSNVFMGPSERGDDPGEHVDATFENGLPTHQSALAELLGSSGGLRDVKDKVDDDSMKSPLENSKANREHSKGRLGEMLLRNLRDNGQGGTEKGHAKPYKQGEWTKDKNNAPIRVQPGVQGRKWDKDEKDKPKLSVPKPPPPKVDTGKKNTKGKK